MRVYSLRILVGELACRASLILNTEATDSVTSVTYNIFSLYGPVVSDH